MKPRVFRVPRSQGPLGPHVLLARIQRRLRDSQRCLQGFQRRFHGRFQGRIQSRPSPLPSSDVGSNVGPSSDVPTLAYACFGRGSLKGAPPFTVSNVSARASQPPIQCHPQNFQRRLKGFQRRFHGRLQRLLQCRPPSSDVGSNVGSSSDIPTLAYAWLRRRGQSCAKRQTPANRVSADNVAS